MSPKQWTPDEEIAIVIRKNAKTFGKNSPLVGTRLAKIPCSLPRKLRGPRFFKKNQKLGIERVFAGGSTAHTNYAVNLEDDEEEAEFDTPPEPVRPTGRDTTKRASSSSRQTISSNPTTTRRSTPSFHGFQKQKHEDRKKMHEKKSLRADLRAMELMPPELVDDEDREIMKKNEKEAP
ncbi:hypothetical protein R6Q57_020100 [Mikania cordata]